MAQSSGGRVGGRPANPDPEVPRSRSIFIYSAQGGETKTDELLVTNNTNTEQTIELYAVDGMVTNTGAYTCRQKAEARTGLGLWIQLTDQQVTIAPHSTKNVEFSLTLPRNADVGEHNGCLVMQPVADEGEIRGSVRVRTRQAIRVVATVPGNLHREVDINSFLFTQNPGPKGGYQQQYRLDIRNVGNVSADVDAKVYLTTLWGTVVYENGGGYPVLANEKLELPFTNDTRPFFGGWYFARATVKYDERAGTFGTADKDRLIHKEAGRKLVFITPTLGGMLVIILCLGIIVGAIFSWVRLRRQRKTAKQTWGTYTVTTGDSIESLARRCRTNWRRIARVNKLKPPYNLRPGMRIKLPMQSSVNRKSVRRNSTTELR